MNRTGKKEVIETVPHLLARIHSFCKTMCEDGTVEGVRACIIKTCPLWLNRCKDPYSAKLEANKKRFQGSQGSQGSNGIGSGDISKW